MTIYTKFYISNTQHFFETNHSIICLAEGENAHKKILKFIKIHENENLNIDILHSFEHENIIKPENEFRYNEFYCLVFPFTNQQSLNHLLRTQYPDGLPEQLSSKIFYQILNAVQYLHIMNVCHNDITCDKVLVFNTDPVKILILLSRYTSIILPNQINTKYNKRILFFLLEKGFVKPDKIFLNQYLASTHNKKEPEMPQIFYYLYPKMKEFLDEKLQKQIEEEISQKYSETISSFEEKCQIGENNSCICSLIRSDSVEEFIAYVNRTNISLLTKIKPSFYETHSFLIYIFF